MANEIKLEVYTIKAREKGEKDKLVNINSIQGKNFNAFFQEYIKSFDLKIQVNDEQKRSLKLDSSNINVNADLRTISGVIHSGDYGYESEGINIETGKTSYTRRTTDTEILPFYFLLILPEKENKGYVILQRFGGKGIHTIFKKHLSEYFKNKFENHLLEFDPYVSRQLANSFIENGDIKKFTLTRYNLPSDIAEQLNFIGHEEDIMSIELTIKAKKNRKLPLNNRVKSFIQNPNARMFTSKPLDDLGFNGVHKSKIEVKHNGNSRTIDLGDTFQLRPYYDIDKTVKKDTSGHPVFESIDRIAKDLLQDLLVEIGKK